MATGKRARDIFTQATKTPAGVLEVAPRPVMGRPRTAEPYQKVTICLYNRQILFLDRVALEIRTKTGKPIRRAELVRALVEQAAETLNPAAKDFPRTIRSLLRLQDENAS
jgi:hypothetical protein